MQMPELIVDKELQTLLPCSTADEDERLEREILANGGPTDPIRVWKGHGIIVDGHRRYAICEKHGLSYDVEEFHFDDREAAIRWMVEWQFARRNLSDASKAIALARLTEVIHRQAGGDPSVRRAAVKEAAQTAGVSERSVYRAEDYTRALDSLPMAFRDKVLEYAHRRGDVMEFADLKEEKQRGVLQLLGTHGCPDLGSAMQVASRLPGPKKVKSLEGKEHDAFVARQQLKVYADTIARWLSQSPSIDDFRRKWPSHQGDRAIKAASELYEALKKWIKAIR